MGKGDTVVPCRKQCDEYHINQTSVKYCTGDIVSIAQRTSNSNGLLKFSPQLYCLSCWSFKTIHFHTKAYCVPLLWPFFVLGFLLFPQES